MTRWDLDLVATSSVTHGGDIRGVTKMFRRETVVLPDGSRVQVPVVSGNSLRGRLRRVGEELLRDLLQYEGQLTPAAAHTLRGGGSLVKASGEPLSGARLARVRQMVPQLSVFGGGASGAIIDGALSVGKVVPHLRETAHLVGGEVEVSAFGAVQLEVYGRADDADAHDFAGVPSAEGERSTSLMQYQVETLPAGTRFSSWVALSRPSEVELSFFTEVLDRWSRDGLLGGRVGTGHGRVRVEVSPRLRVDGVWREFVLEHRDEVLDAIGLLT